MAKDSTKEKRASLIKRLLIFVGGVIVLFNVVQLLFVTTNAKKNIVEKLLPCFLANHPQFKEMFETPYSLNDDEII